MFPKVTTAAVGLAAALTGVGLVASPAAAVGVPTANFVLADFGYDQGWRVDQHPRFMADITGDGRADIVGMGNAGVYTAVATGTGGFGPAQFVLADFGYDQGWRAEDARFVADVNADGRADLVGVRTNGVHVALANGAGGFTKVQSGGGPFGTVPGTATKFLTADVNADGRTDLVRQLNTSDHQLRVATAALDGTFSTAITATTAYDFFNYDFETFSMADVTGDRRAEIIAMQVVGPIRMVSSSPILDGTGRYTNPQPAGAAFPPALPAPSVALAAVTDVTGDGRADLVAYGTSVPGTWVARSLGDGTFGPYQQAGVDFGENQGWVRSRHPRPVADVTGDGTGDVVAFGDTGVYTALSRGDGTVTGAQFVVADFGYNQGWRVESHPRFAVDITGDRRADIVGFGNAGVYTATSRGDGTFAGGPAIVTVPDVRGDDIDQAAADLQAAGLTVGQISGHVDQFCNNIGLVMSQSPGPGSQVIQGTAVNLTIGEMPPTPCP